MDNVTRELFSSSGDRLIPGLSIADIAEAALRPNLRVVREKTRDELDLQAYHRISVAAGLAPDRDGQSDPGVPTGIAIRPGLRALRTSLFDILKNRADEISPRMSDLIVGLYEDETITAEIGKIAAEQAACKGRAASPIVMTGPRDGARPEQLCNRADLPAHANAPARSAAWHHPPPVRATALSWARRGRLGARGC